MSGKLIESSSNVFILRQLENPMDHSISNLEISLPSLEFNLGRILSSSYKNLFHQKKHLQQIFWVAENIKESSFIQILSNIKSNNWAIFTSNAYHDTKTSLIVKTFYFEDIASLSSPRVTTSSKSNTSSSKKGQSSISKQPKSFNYDTTSSASPRVYNLKKSVTSISSSLAANADHTTAHNVNSQSTSSTPSVATKLSHPIKNEAIVNSSGNSNSKSSKVSTSTNKNVSSDTDQLSNAANNSSVHTPLSPETIEPGPTAAYESNPLSKSKPQLKSNSSPNPSLSPFAYGTNEMVDINKSGSPSLTNQTGLLPAPRTRTPSTASTLSDTDVVGISGSAASSAKEKAETVDVEHQASRTAHYAKLGSVFKVNNGERNFLKISPTRRVG